MALRVYIETYGCQMNVADSELIAGILDADGFTRVADEDAADVILLNTCAVREKAEDRIFGRLGWLKPKKEARPDLVLGVAGCMAEHLRDALAKRAPHVDIIAGPDAYRRMPAMIRHAREGDGGPAIDVRLDRQEFYDGLDSARARGVSGYVTIMRGCNKFCTFCIVPYVRGRERCVPPDEVLRQAQQMADAGFKEVTLLGQTVSSYREGGCGFAALLTRVCDIEALERVRFTSPYPSDFDERLLETIASLPKVGRHLHLPLQSGSSEVLADMRRGYGADDYRRLVQTIRREMPEFSITTDIIVGYPGETEADFEQTLALSAEIAFDAAFMFKYSERSMTAAARRRPDDVPEEVKGERLQRLIKLQEQNSRLRSAAFVGRRVEILIEGKNPRDASQSMGRTSCFKGACVDGDYPPGKMLRAEVMSASTHTLFAQVVA